MNTILLANLPELSYTSQQLGTQEKAPTQLKWNVHRIFFHHQISYQFSRSPQIPATDFIVFTIGTCRDSKMTHFIVHVSRSSFKIVCWRSHPLPTDVKKGTSGFPLKHATRSANILAIYHACFLLATRNAYNFSISVEFVWMIVLVTNKVNSK